MHHDQLSVSRDQVAALVAEQLPALAGHEVVLVDGGGTVHTIYRIGDVVAARFPISGGAADVVASRMRLEQAASAEFARACPVAAPEPLHLGRPGHGYPLPWTTQSWLPGSTATPTSWAHAATLAADLAELVVHLRAWDTRGRTFRGTGRGGELADHDRWVDQCITRSEHLVDVDVVRAMWSRLRTLPREDPDVMCHGDLIPSNVLVGDGRLQGVLDTGGFRPADPALDLVAVWHLLADGPREQVRRMLGCSELQWERGKAWAFEQAIGAYWYYRSTNRAMADMGRTTLERLVDADS